ncbi:MAG: hypothetical protein IIV43_00535 [Oscillospiraceae bacterium]|nr:hypothetical protein [Oscillospiraceae bacterium]
MQFNTYIFILLFLPSLVAGYYGLCKFSALAAKLFLVGMSFVFYGYAGIPELQWLLVSPPGLPV